MIRIAGYFVFLSSLIFFVIPVQSSETKIYGIDSPKFVAVKKAWLDGKDEIALKELARLSRGGNTAAQILLANIEPRVNMHVQVTSQFSRKQRIELLRIPKGLSGKSWLTEAEKTASLAAALMQAKRAESLSATIPVLVEHGEPLTAILTIGKLLNQGKISNVITGLQEFGSDPPQEAIALYFHATEFQIPNRDDSSLVKEMLARYDERMRLIGRLEWDGPSHLDVLNSNRLHALMGVTTEVKHWSPLRKFCEKHCPEVSKACTVRLASSMNFAGLFSMRSPLESTISNEEYWSSSRIEGDLARQLPDIQRLDNMYLKDGDGSPTCYFDKMKRLQSVYGFSGKWQ